MADSPTTHTRRPSARSLIAVTGAAAMAVTLAHATATQATPSSTVSSDAQVATGNYYPTPLTAEVRCRTNPNNSVLVTRNRAEVSWDAVPGATGYILELVEYNNGNPGGAIKQTYQRDAGETLVVGDIRDSDRDVLYARVRTVNGPAVSSGYTTPPQRISYKDIVSGRTECENTSRPNQDNQPWEDTHEWDPGSAAPAANRSGLTELRSTRTSDDDGPVAVTAEPTESTSATSSASSASASAPSTSESSTARTTSPVTSTTSPSSPSTSPTSSPGTSTRPGTSTPPTTTETPRQVKPQLTRTTAAPSGAVTAGMTADGRVALVDGDGIQLVDGEVGSSVELQWQNGVDILWIIGPAQVHRIMKSVDGTWKFYLDSGQNLPDGIG